MAYLRFVVYDDDDDDVVVALGCLFPDSVCGGLSGFMGCYTVE